MGTAETFFKSRPVVLIVCFASPKEGAEVSLPSNVTQWH